MRGKMTLKRIAFNQILGMVLGVAIALFFFIEAEMFILYWSSIGSAVDERIMRIGAIVLSFLLFILVAKYFYKHDQNGLVHYFFFSIIMSLFAVFTILCLSAKVMDGVLIQEKVMEYLENEQGQFAMIVIGNLYIIFLVIVFVCCIALLLRPKIRYITYISGEVEKMEEEGFGHTIEVKGSDELAGLSRRINSMSLTLKEKQEQELEEEESKNRLIADISHDLRTPLTSIMGYVDLIKENGFEDKDKFDQYMEVVERRLNNLKSLTDQLFEYTKLNQKDLHLRKEETDLVPLLNYINFEYGSLYKRLGYKWSMHVNAESIPMELDVEKFMRAMENLLENAKKYSSPNTEIELVVEQKKDYVSIRLSNETDEVTEQNINHIFERFYKADEARNSSTSTGLGLPIVKKIIELHSGTIQARLVEKRISFEIVMNTLN
ncbi:MAG: HAMP domain-containing histidine kinase [Lachnospiraceae bacterium]|nr:HAMP domain-containing histidine kinase [Lachnospiraceae bacterium]